MFCFVSSSGNQVVLNVMERVPGSRTYKPPREFVWNLGRGADPASLRQGIADFLAKPVENVVIAKHVYDKHVWLVIKDGATGQVCGPIKAIVCHMVLNVCTAVL